MHAYTGLSRDNWLTCTAYRPGFAFANLNASWSHRVPLASAIELTHASTTDVDMYGPICGAAHGGDKFNQMRPLATPQRPRLGDAVQQLLRMLKNMHDNPYLVHAWGM